MVLAVEGSIDVRWPGRAHQRCPLPQRPVRHRERECEVPVWSAGNALQMGVHRSPWLEVHVVQVGRPEAQGHSQGTVQGMGTVDSVSHAAGMARRAKSIFHFPRPSQG